MMPPMNTDLLKHLPESHRIGATHTREAAGGQVSLDGVGGVLDVDLVQTKCRTGPDGARHTRLEVVGVVPAIERLVGDKLHEGAPRGAR